METIVVVGLGYIGLPTAAALARAGHRVIGVDVSDRHVDAVNRGEVPFVEPDLADVVKDNVDAGRLSATKTTPAADVYIIAVPTPFTEGHRADLSYIDAATNAIAPQLSGGELVILESTSPPGTTDHVRAVLANARPELTDLQFAHCPERVLPGRIMVELVTNDRIVGGLSREAAERAAAIYKSFCEGQIHLTDAATAEMAKLTENAFRDVNIAFANELSVIAQHLGIDVWELIDLANKHPRVNILQPGPGVGGHCIAVDPWFIVSSAPEQTKLIQQARAVNDAKPEWVIDQVRERIASLQSPVVAALGLAFKADVDDLRESPAIQIVERLAREFPDARILAVEPNIQELPKDLAGRGVTLAELPEAMDEADVVLMLVDHREFREIPAEALTGKQVIDTKGVWRKPRNATV
ncbi:UDP-N-acetyl-D-mannosamine dehydrogenase [Tessaracoccus sp. SD287]|uniref:UDP-N-acetyl-D-mannosamine dehydrogenase n=1 Tax=Tessaracoccus sp. SD287 TaxID=2782008 RepID=UPI001A96A3F3|nr:UDP-N-acetyl-D-mannosamine dehydrogenase [Tessaracoccus sp. SD287]MBO1031871.1 UDP-N-acetyl-D-mannosamine dehydrogenase [Tessaracoccus sp. SD287]